MRTYGQYCPVARALDVVGDRWTLLIIRELTARDARYSDLRGALPGIATNLLADRLRQLQTDGLVEAYDAPPPIGATVYRLSERGRELRPVIRELASWGLPLLDTGQGEDQFRTQWLILTLRATYSSCDAADLAPLTVAVHTGGEPARICIQADTIAVDFTDPGDLVADVHLEGEPDGVMAFLTGTVSATAAGVQLRGPRHAVQRLRALTRRSHAA